LEENKEINVLNTKADPDETDLIIRAKRGDKNAFGRLVKRHQKRVLRMVVGMTGDIDSAMDIVQESFIRAYGALDRFEEGKPFYPWLSTIATNLTINFIKKGRREIGLDAVGQEKIKSGADPLRGIQLKENDRRLMQAVQELPDQYREVFILRNIEDMSYEDIAARLEISIGTVDSRLYRARRQLLEKLKDLLE
jgi:RNA polymerase sigma-70 factor (ECF subfamily)